MTDTIKYHTMLPSEVASFVEAHATYHTKTWKGSRTRRTRVISLSMSAVLMFSESNYVNRSMQVTLTLEAAH